MLKKVASENRELMSIQQNVEQEINSIRFNPFINGVLAENVALTTGDNVINHKLQRRLTGWQIVRTNAGAIIYETAVDDKTITLNASAPVTVSIRFF